jgi:hypothetical protein
MLATILALSPGVAKLKLNGGLVHEGLFIKLDHTPAEAKASEAPGKPRCALHPF